jgi:hypothetical protein
MDADSAREKWPKNDQRTALKSSLPLSFDPPGRRSEVCVNPSLKINKIV